MKIMRYLSWLLRIVLFLLLLGFAIKNSDLVTLRYYMGYEWQAPLVLIILVFLLVGIVIGIAANLGFVFKQKREILGLKKELRLKSQVTESELSEDGSAQGNGI